MISFMSEKPSFYPPLSVTRGDLDQKIMRKKRSISHNKLFRLYFMRINEVYEETDISRCRIYVLATLQQVDCISNKILMNYSNGS